MVDFKAHLKKIRAQAAPNLNPPPRVEKTIEVIPDLREVITGAEDRTTFHRLAAQYAALGAEEREAKKAKEALGVRLKALCNDYSVEKVQAGDVRLSYYQIRRATIQAHLLRARGVSQAIINDCTTTSEAWALRASLPGMSSEEEE